MRVGVARRVAYRFVAGEDAEAALVAAGRLTEKGITATLDLLGEAITHSDQALRTTESYLQLLDQIADSGIGCWVSLKLTALGIDIDPALCRHNLHRILSRASEIGIHVTIDMEDHPYTDATLALFRALVNEEGFDNLRTVIQAYLYRSEEDITALAAEGAGIRLCKGAYKEAAAIAYPDKSDVDSAYDRLMMRLMDAAAEGRGYPGIATHDEDRIKAVKAYASKRGIALDRFEFQMLYGIRTTLQDSLVEEGYQMRVYVPYGTDWYPYFVRRLAERPANLWFFLSNLVRR